VTSKDHFPVHDGEKGAVRVVNLLADDEAGTGLTELCRSERDSSASPQERTKKNAERGRK
jgi:hypothetical protein